jgi:tetratricopeptide (TPR) repeat protein
LEIEKKNLGDDHINYATTLNNLCITLEKLGDFEKAKACYLKVLEIKKKHLGEDHIDFAITLNNLCIILKNFGEYEKAIDGY